MNGASVKLRANSVLAKAPNLSEYLKEYLITASTFIDGTSPVEYDESTGKYVPMDDSVKPVKHTMPIFAQGSYKWHLSPYAEENAEFTERILQWQDLTQEN